MARQGDRIVENQVFRRGTSPSPAAILPCHHPPQRRVHHPCARHPGGQRRGGDPDRDRARRGCLHRPLEREGAGPALRDENRVGWNPADAGPFSSPNETQPSPARSNPRRAFHVRTWAAASPGRDDASVPWRAGSPVPYDRRLPSAKNRNSRVRSARTIRHAPPRAHQECRQEIRMAPPKQRRRRRRGGRRGRSACAAFTVICCTAP